MQYRKFGKTDWQVSALGFGAMRLPLNSRDLSDINEAESIQMMRYAIDQGVNYVDTAYLYHGGRSEEIVGKALQNGYRSKVKLATKMPCWMVNSFGDADQYLEEQLQRLQTDYLDFYLFHGLNENFWPKVRDLKLLSWAEKAMSRGKIKGIGFSFHDTFEVLKKIIDSYDNWDLCQIQYNYMDVAYQAGTRGLKYAAQKGLAVVIMEPVRGGQLSKDPPPEVAALWNKARKRRLPVEWALQWVWNHPEVSVALSGMSSMEHVRQNIEIAGRSEPGVLNAEDLDLVDRVRDTYHKTSPVPCTGCAYCMPCPQGVQIPTILGAYNDAITYGDLINPRFTYRITLTDGQRADQCVDCQECILICPQKIQIPSWLKKAHDLLGPKPKKSSDAKSS